MTIFSPSHVLAADLKLSRNHFEREQMSQCLNMISQDLRSVFILFISTRDRDTRSPRLLLQDIWNWFSGDPEPRTIGYLNLRVNDEFITSDERRFPNFAKSMQGLQNRYLCSLQINHKEPKFF